MLSPFVLVSVLAVHDPQYKVHHHGRQQCHSQHGRTQAVVESSLPSLSYALRSPVEREEGVDHGCHRYQCEQSSRYSTNLIAKVEEADCETTEDDGEVQP